ncbi:hypothetical protein CF326_g1253 [Tilletia indica]|nr:hypothetical protein CF326_g1253 [Tilletia indica]
MAQPPTAAIAVACIFAGLAALYFSYRIYLKIYNRGARKLAEQQQQQEAQLALSSSHSAKYPPSAPIASAFHNNHRPAYTPFHHHHFSSSTPQTTYNTNNTTQVNTFSSSTTSATNKSLLHPQTATPSPLQSNSSSSLSSSAIASPTTDQTSTQQLHDAVVAAAVLNSEADPQHQPTPAPLPITLGSNTTTGAIQRQYAAARQYGTAPNGTLTPSALATLGSNGGGAATNGPGSVYAGSEGNGSAAGNGNAGSVLGVPSLYGGQRIKRESYLPHLNRDAMQIVTPSPLGFGLGGMATATDQRTLAFSKASGIGDHESLLSDPLLSSTIVPGAPYGNAQGGPPSAGGAVAPPSGEWEQRINAYRTGAASAGGSSVGHAPRGSVSSLSGVVGPGPSTNTPAAEYLAQQQRQLRLNASGQQQQQQQQQHQQPHTMTPTSRRSNGPSGSSPSSPAPPPSSYRPPPLNTMYAGPPRAPSPSRSSPQSSTGPPSSAVPDLEEQRRLSALTARQSPLQRMSSGEIWSENAK